MVPQPDSSQLLDASRALSSGSHFYVPSSARSKPSFHPSLPLRTAHFGATNPVSPTHPGNTTLPLHHFQFSHLNHAPGAANFSLLLPLLPFTPEFSPSWQRVCPIRHLFTFLPVKPGPTWSITFNSSLLRYILHKLPLSWNIGCNLRMRIPGRGVETPATACAFTLPPVSAWRRHCGDGTGSYGLTDVLASEPLETF